VNHLPNINQIYGTKNGLYTILKESEKLNIKDKGGISMKDFF
jgi:hypothetical protein